MTLATSTELDDQLIAGAAGLVEQARTLRQWYTEEHQRFADALKFLTAQQRNLDDTLCAFEQVAAIVGDHFGGAAARLRRQTHPVPARVSERLTRLELVVRCFGGFELRCGGRQIEPGTSRKGRLVLKYLLVRAPGRRASKEQLADLFWPDVPLERALVSLQSAVYQLRRALAESQPRLAAEPLVIYADDQYRLNPSVSIECDVEVFRRRLVEARSQDAQGNVDQAAVSYGLALEAHTGELLPEERYEEWVISERSSLQADQIAILARLMELSAQQGAYARAIECGRRVLEVDPTREDVHRELIKCYGRSGQRGEALRQFRRCAKVLRHQLGLRPEPETTTLFKQLACGASV